MKRFFFIIPLLLIFFTASAQQQKSIATEKVPVKDSSVFFKKMFFKNPMQDYHYFNQMGVMCKMEYKMQKAVKVPISFRVGSLEECKKREAIPVKYP